MKVQAYIHSLKDKENGHNVLGEAEILECIGDNQYLAEYNGIRCTAIFNFFTGRYYVDDVYGIRGKSKNGNRLHENCDVCRSYN